MKVAIIDPSCLTWPYTPRLCKAIAEHGCEVHLVASRFLYSSQEYTGPFHKWDHFYRGTVWLYSGRPRGFLRNYIKGLEHVMDMFRLVRFLRWLKPDVIHFQICPIPLIDKWYISALRRISLTISTVHDSTPLHGEASRLQLWGFRSFLTQFVGLIVHTESSRKKLTQSLRIPDQQISVIPHALFDHYAEIGTSDSSSPFVPLTRNEQVVLFFGNISYYKGLDILIRAFAELPSELLRRVRLGVYGNPQIPMGPLKTLAEEAGIQDRVTWDLRWVAEEEVYSIFKQATVVVLPHRHVDASGVLATALTHGKPIVATRIGGFADILQDGVHGYLVDPEDPSSMAVALENILTNEKKARVMGAAVRQLAHGMWSWDMVAQETVRLYNHLDHQENHR